MYVCMHVCIRMMYRVYLHKHGNDGINGIDYFISDDLGEWSSSHNRHTHMYLKHIHTYTHAQMLIA
jgi:hypothetical protein